MAGLADILLASAAADAVAVYDSGSFTQVFKGARPIKANVTETSKVMEHPVEDGTVITDHKIINPIDIELSMLIGGATYQSIYQQIKQLYIAGTLLTVQTKSASYSNMIISDMPHDEAPEMYDTLAMGLKFHQVQFVSATFGTLPPSKVKKKTSASTVKRGQQQATTAVNASLLARLGHYLVPGK